MFVCKYSKPLLWRIMFPFAGIVYLEYGVLRAWDRMSGFTDLKDMAHAVRWADKCMMDW